MAAFNDCLNASYKSANSIIVSINKGTIQKMSCASSENNDVNRSKNESERRRLSGEQQHCNNNRNRRNNNDNNNDNDDDNNTMVDITDMIDRGISSLSIHEPFLCHDDTFNLHDAMAASQLTDKKMDSCQIPAHLASPLVYHSSPPSQSQDDHNNNSNDEQQEQIKALFPRPPPTRLLDDPFLGPLPWHDLDTSQACHIVLEMLVRMQALFCGASVCESTFTCFYVHAGVLADMEELCLPQQQQHALVDDVDDDDAPDQALLRHQFERLSTKEQDDNDDLASSTSSTSTFLSQFVVFSMAYVLLDITDIFRGIVMNADIYEEEDFVSSIPHGIVMYDILQGAAQRHVQMALKLLSARLEQLLQTSSASSSSSSSSSSQSSTMQQEEGELLDIQCMILVLQSMLGFYKFCNRMAKVCGPDIDKTVTSMQQLAQSTVQNLQRLHHQLLLRQQQQQPDDDDDESEVARNIQARCFDAYVNRPLLGNAPVRKVNFPTPHDAVLELMNVAEQLDWAVCRLLLHGTCLSRIERMLDRVCTSSSRGTGGGVNILARSLIVLNLYFDDKLLGRLDVSQLLGHHLQQWQDIPAVYRTCWPVLHENKNLKENDDSATAATVTSSSTTTTSSSSSMSTEAATDDSKSSASVSCQQQEQEQDPARAFFGRLAKPVYDTLKLRTSNRNRQRTYLEAVIFRDWTALQQEASIVDVHYYHLHQQQQHQQQYYDPRDPTIPLTTSSGMQAQEHHRHPPPCFGHFVLSTLIRLMDRHLSCGVELGLFHGHDELCSAFWYRDFVLAALSQNLHVMRKGKDDARLQQQQAAAETTPTTTVTPTTSTPSSATSSPIKGGKAGKKKNHKNKVNGKHAAKKGSTGSSPSPTNETSPAVSPEELEDDCEMQVLEIKRMLCRGLVRFIVSLRQAGFLTMPRYPFTSLERIFCKRFQVFQSIRHPPALTFGDYLEGSNASSVSLADIVQSTVEVFHSCKAAIDRLLTEYYNDTSSTKIDPMYAPLQEDEVRGLLKVCVGNSVYLMRLQQLLRPSSSTTSEKKVKVKVDFDFDAHKEFCIIKLS
jgi:Mak10 subunit, NatC N(alpha)-terminal acetyltransferase